MKNKKPFVYKRVIAYFIDIMIVSALSSILSLALPKNDTYKTKMDELSKTMEKFQNKEIDKDEWTKAYEDISYDISKSSISSSIIIIVVSVGYFVLFNYYNDGQTLGKKIMKLKIVSSNGNPLTINNYVLRSLIINSVLSQLISALLLCVLSKDNYLLYGSNAVSALSLVSAISFVFAIYRSDGRGFHDLISNTVVISSIEDEKKEDIKEAVLVKEESQDIKENDAKKNSKKGSKKK